MFGTCAFIVRPSALTVTSVQLSFRSVVISPSFTSSLEVAFHFHSVANVVLEVTVAVKPIEDRREIAARSENARLDPWTG